MHRIRILLLSFYIICLGFSKVYSQCWRILESGANHTVGIHLDGTLWAWGNNSQGEVGDGTTINKNIPTLISSSTNWVAISAGHSHTLALKSDGTIWSWGYNVHSALGLGAVTQIEVPTQIGISSNWAYIAAGHSNSFAIKTDGTIWGWGINYNGEVGDGTTTPKQIPTLIGTDNNWQKVFTGNLFTAAIKTDGTLWTWGSYNNFGELGSGNYTSHFTPFQIGSDTDWKSVSTELTFGLALKTNGTIWSWGNNSFGQLGLGTVSNVLSPTQIGTDADWKSVEAGNYKSFFIKNNGTLWGCGNPFLGTGNSISSNVLIQIGSDTNWSTVSSQLFQTIALKTNNIGFGWGSNYFGQIGNGYTDNGSVSDPNDYTSPVQINCPCTTITTPTFSISQTICSGSTPPNLPSIASNSISGTWSPSVISNTISGSYVFTPDAVLFPCASSITIAITVLSQQTPTFAPFPSTLCQFSVAPVLPTYSSNATPILGVWNPPVIDTSIIGQTTYVFVPDSGQCVSSIPYQFLLTVQPSVVSDFPAINPICLGSSVPILSNVAPNGVIGTWSPPVIDPNTSNNYVFTPTTTGCFATQTLQVTILPPTTPDFSNILICKGDHVSLPAVSPNGISGSWNPAVIDMNLGGNYTFTPNNFQCASPVTITVTINESLIQNISYNVSEYFSNHPTLSVTVQPTGNYSYQLDNGNYQLSPIFENVAAGSHTINVMDIDGCNTVHTIFDITIVSYPIYFTPNGDNYNDTWNLIGANETIKAKIYIFDRYGKLLKQLSPLGTGWDGNFNNLPMPSTDYWFRIDYIENGIQKQFNSHFALKR